MNYRVTRGQRHCQETFMSRINDGVGFHAIRLSVGGEHILRGVKIS